MGLLSIGIYEDVVLSTETGVVEDKMLITLEIKPSDEDVVKAMAEGRILEAAKSNMMQFYPNMDRFGDKGKKDYTELLGDFMKFKGMFEDYCRLLTTEEEVIAKVGGVQAFIKMGVPPEGIADAFKRLTDETFAKRVWLIQFELFADFLKTVDNLGDIKLRHKFWRSSKAKAFAAIPSPGGKVFVESMDVPVEDSKITWSTWELEKGKNDATEVAADKPDASNAEAAADMFDMGGSEEEVPAGFAETPTTDIM